MRKEVRQHDGLARLAEDQYGVVSRSQLVKLGYSDAAVSRAVRSGRLHRLLRGAYAVGHAAVPPHGRCLAAVLACGSGALLSHSSSAWLWGLTGTCPIRPHVTVPTRGHQHSSVQLHHSTILTDEDCDEFERIPTTAVPRTMLDLAANHRARRLESVIEKAEHRGLLDIDRLDSILARAGGHPGRDRLQQAIAIYRDPIFSRVHTERLFLALINKAGLPQPAINNFVAGHEIDAYWEAERFAVEVDGWDTHRTRAAFERDPLRIEDLKLAGIDAIRITARRIEREPETVGRRLRAHLERCRNILGRQPSRARPTRS